MLFPLERPNFGIRFADVSVNRIPLPNDSDMTSWKNLIKKVATAHYDAYKKCWDDAKKIAERATSEKELYQKLVRFPVPKPSRFVSDIQHLFETGRGIYPEMKDVIHKYQYLIEDVIPDVYDAIKYGIHQGLAKGNAHDTNEGEKGLNELKRMIDRI